MTRLVATLFLSSLFLVAACGGSPCDDLRDRCGECPAEVRGICETAAEGAKNAGGDDACQNFLDDFSC
ncbi:MAG: hypothetical protein HC923_01610 [Myxococcales bacterium]|nr:hypothetical protein [Myxococcales bacterium]